MVQPDTRDKVAIIGVGFDELYMPLHRYADGSAASPGAIHRAAMSVGSVAVSGDIIGLFARFAATPVAFRRFALFL